MCCSTALQEYTGTVVFVSHDRYFIDKLATRVIEVADGRRARLSRQLRRLPVAQAEAREAEPREAGRRTKPDARRRLKSKDASSIRSSCTMMKERRRELEDEVTRLEGEIAGYERSLANFTSAEKTMRTSELLGARRADLETLMNEWEQVSQTIEANR